MAEIKLIAIQEAELREIIRQEVTAALKQHYESHNDALLNIAQICESIPGMTRYRFKKLEAKAKLNNLQGRYSLNAVKVALHLDS
ncbi:hypothetical protein [Acinetobacter pseudolwoffii]|uniref:hypothetical protein n=1 Tax=Acinetobacter pseudolwoffii TaxID=2053287 RepID=UPI001D0CFECC|nr:hypothetical protein [Acinetobacter pseudolwoffii]